MEIRNVVNEVKNEYPKMDEVSKKYLANSVPSKWLKVGLSSLVIAMVMKNKAFAVSPKAATPNANMIDIAGGLPAPVPVPIQICNIACPIVQIVSAVVFFITGLSILITKIKSKKKSEPKKVKKWVKIVFIISIIVFILSILIKFIISAF